MKILVIDKDPLIAQFIKSKLEPIGHSIDCETSKTDAVKLSQEKAYDLILLDPSPLTSPRTLVMDIRRHSTFHPYKILLTERETSHQEALQFGVNDVIIKPLNPDMLVTKVENAIYFSRLIARMNDDSEDFPNAGGIISKGAFNQLFLSAIDRSERYGEETYLLFISVSNYKEISSNSGPYVADYTVAKLSKYLTNLRRQSDIIGQTASNEYCLLLQRPVYETEPTEAANRFIEALMGYEGFKELDTDNIEINVTLSKVPSGMRPISQTFRPIDIMASRQN